MNQRIEFIVKKSGLTKAKFAEKIGVSAPYVTMLCAGNARPSDRTISDICREFGCDEVWLRTGEGEPFRQESQQDMIMRFASQTVKGSDDFRKAFVVGLAKLEPQDWQNLAQIFKKFNEAYEKE